MDWRLPAWSLIVVIGLLGVVGHLGCSRSKAPPPAAAAARPEKPAAPALPPAMAAGGGWANNVDAAAHESQPAAPLAPDAARTPSYQPRSEFEIKETTVDGALQSPPRDAVQQPAASVPVVDHGGNPFRTAAPQPAPIDEHGNPLRAARAQPPAAAPREHWSRAQPPLPAGPRTQPDQSAISDIAAAPPEFGAPDSAPSGAAEPVAGLVSAASQPSTARDYDVVEVFYGTDRQAAEAARGAGMQLLGYFWPSGASVLITLCLAFVATLRRNLLVGLMAVGGIGVSLGLIYQDTVLAVAAVRNAGKSGPQYTAERSAGGRVDLGTCAITIPHKHAVGEVESPSLVRLELLEDASRHVVLQKTERLASLPFNELLRQRVNQSARREVFVFIHGFNVSFEDAARRTAQIHYDLKFDGAPLFFSWPAHDKFIFTYPADETNVAWSVPHLKQFLLEIVKESQARSINLIAHSMGNRALAAALREIELEMRDRARIFNQVILAAPDIDADDFRNNIAPAMQRTAQRLTLYASARDDALLVSQLLHQEPRAGDAGEGLVVVDGIDTIDVTAIDTSPWGHSYYGSSDPVLHDLKALFSEAVPPRDRIWLSPAQHDGLTYWIFQPARTATAGETSPR